MTNINDIIGTIKTAATALATSEQDSFGDRVGMVADIGDGFRALIAFEQASLEDGATDVKPNTVYKKYASKLGKVYAQSPMVNHALPLAIARADGRIEACVTKWFEVGDGTKASKNADGTVKARIDLFASAVHADASGRWNKGGSIRKTSGNAKKSKAEQIEALTAEIAPFELAAWTVDELKALRAACSKALELLELKAS